MISMLIVYLLIALGVSFLCSILEAVLLSISPGYVASQAGTGGRFGRRLAGYKRNIDKPLAAILTLNTFAHTIGAAGVGAEAQKIWGSESLAVVSALVTIVILIGSEIIPKTIGAVAWRRLARPSVAIINWLCLLLWPFVALSERLTRLLRRGAEARGSVLSRDDIQVIAAEGYRDGVLRRSEHSIIANLMATGARTVSDIMRPKDQVVGLHPTTSLNTLTPLHPAWHRSRLPLVANGKATSYVLKDEILAKRLAGARGLTAADLRRDMVTIAPEAPLSELYAALIECSEHIAAVANHDGQLVGLVTMEDLIEDLLGLEITDETDSAAAHASRSQRISA